MARFFSRVGAIVVGSAALSGLLSGCGQKDTGGGGGGPAVGPTYGAFLQAAADSGVPARILMATGYLESRLTAPFASANYVNVADPTKHVGRGTLMTETAFGQSLKALGLDPTKDESATLQVQVAAYARYLGDQFKAAGVALSADPRTPDDWFYLISNVAMLQRKGLSGRQNVRILFARELIQVLNTGFIWQDPANGETLTVAPQATPIDPATFSANGQQWMQMYEPQTSLLGNGIQRLPLATVPSGQFVNKPKHVLVVHCPLSLSGCLELQTRNEESDIHLAAHFIIPPIVANSGRPDPELNKPLQVAELDNALVLTDNTGENVPVEDAVVIMLVGNSGRIVDGKRQPAVPIWFNDFQLRAMGQLINDVCTYLAQKDATVDRNTCLSTSSDKGVTFRVQGKSEEDRWGDIADFDPTIFDAYVANASGLPMAVAFDFGKGQHQFNAGDTVPLVALFDSAARTLELERLSRCADKTVVWEPVRTDQVRAQTAMTLNEVFHDSGPNGDGEQFFRLRVYGADGALVGWSIDHLYLAGFEATPTFASQEHCGGGTAAK